MLLPNGDFITLTISASSVDADLYIESASIKSTTEKFDRQEFSNSKLKELRSSNGNSPIYQENIVKNVIQYQYVGPCGDSEARATGVDDDNISLIKNKFIKKTWRLSGKPSSPTAVDTIELVALDHAKRLSRFEGRNEVLSMDNISYQLIKEMQDDDLSYLTSTGLTMTGSFVDEDNLLITDFDSECLYRDTVTGEIIAKGWTMVIESRTIEPLLNG